MTTRHPIYLDCDTGIDDALALAYLLASPLAFVAGIGTVSGNVSAAAGARNTLDLLALAGAAEVPVALGAHDPFVDSFHGGAPWVHGSNGVGEVSLPPFKNANKEIEYAGRDKISDVKAGLALASLVVGIIDIYYVVTEQRRKSLS